ncbi:MAG: hypothetical protein JXA35_10850 [Deltaproteobacteria bacterium]|nr:hypothetical protein [Deltaproteobacteria bacterium]
MEYEKANVSIHHDTAGWGHRRREMNLIIAMILLIFIAGFFFTACECLESSKEGKNMETAIANSAPGVTKPGIDAMSPAKTETATFALG